MQNSITVIDFRIPVSKIADFDKMTEEAKAIIMSSETIESQGTQTVIGRTGRDTNWCAGSHFDHETGMFHFESLGNGKMIKLWK